MGLRVLEPGLYSLLVGRGRVGSRHLGVGVGGPADAAACALGNALVGNRAEALAVEVALLGPTLRAEAPVAGVVFGAPFELSSSLGQPLEVGRTFNLAIGECLKIGGTPGGCRAYLCVAGGFAGREILGSESALEPIRRGDALECRPSFLWPRYPGSVVTIGAGDLRVLPGVQSEWFDSAPFFDQTYTVADASDRMGLRLKGVRLVRPPRELVSEPVAPGTVQITNDGLPVILGVDGQTIGGYPKIAHVIRADLDALGQLRPGDRVRFVGVSPAQAAEAHSAARAALRRRLALWRAGAGVEFR